MAPRADDFTRPAPEWQVVHIHPAAPAKPALGAPCNGCGVCCLAEPCPIGIVVSHRRTGACAAVRWDEPQQLYRCGMVEDPLRQLGWRRAPHGLSAWLGRRLRRWIAAGAGCDASLTTGPPPP
jgi:hypothetical protein